MADYGGVISLSQPPSSDDDDDVSSERSRRSVPSLSGNVGAAIVSASILKEGDSSSVKKPRGRPPGSKNKPKPPIFITKDSESGMKPVVIEISAGSDVVDALIQFARKRSVSISVLSGSGSVSSVTLRHPLSHAPSLTLHGPFSILSLSGSFLHPSLSFSSSPSSSSKPACSNFGICLAGAQGQVFGGIVGGKVVAASLVVVVAAVFVNPSFHRLPNETEGEEEKTTAINGNETCPSSSPPLAMTVYGVSSPLNCQISPDPMHWGSSSRPTF